MERQWSVKKLAEFLKKYHLDSPEIQNKDFWDIVRSDTRPFLEEIKDKLKEQIPKEGKLRIFDDQEKKRLQYFDSLSYELNESTKVLVNVGRDSEYKDLGKSITWGFLTCDKDIKTKMENRLDPKIFKIRYPLKHSDKIGFSGYLFYCKDYIIAEELEKHTEDELVEKIAKELVEVYKFVTEVLGDGPLSAILQALHTKPFLILAGVSGTGKTQIARIIAGVMAREEKKKENENK